MYKVCRELNIPNEVTSIISDYTGRDPNDIDYDALSVIDMFKEAANPADILNVTAMDICRDHMGCSWVRHSEAILELSLYANWAGICYEDDRETAARHWAHSRTCRDELLGEGLAESLLDCIMIRMFDEGTIRARLEQD